MKKRLPLAVVGLLLSAWALSNTPFFQGNSKYRIHWSELFESKGAEKISTQAWAQKVCLAGPRDLVEAMRSMGVTNYEPHLHSCINQMSKSRLYNAVGQPSEITTSYDETYLDWECSNGDVRLTVSTFLYNSGTISGSAWID